MLLQFLWSEIDIQCISNIYVFRLHIFDPLHRLALRIDYEGPTCSPRYYDAIFRAESIGR